MEPARKPIVVAVRPPLRSASSIRSKARAEMRTPAPKAMTPATTGRGTRTSQATTAPTTSMPPASRPHSPAWTQTAMSVPPGAAAEDGSHDDQDAAGAGEPGHHGAGVVAQEGGGEQAQTGDRGHRRRYPVPAGRPTNAQAAQ